MPDQAHQRAVLHRWRKRLRVEVASWDRSRLLTLVFYLRLLCALGFALLFGLVPLTGVGALSAYILVTCFLPTTVLRKFIGVQLETYGENTAWLCFTENLWPAFLLFVLVWTLVYTWRTSLLDSGAPPL